MVKFCFEDLNTSSNLILSTDTTSSGYSRFTVSPLYNRMNVFSSRNLRHWELIKSYDIKDKPERYIIPVGVNNDPSNWCGGGYWETKKIISLFHFINEVYLNDLRNGNAYLMIDSSLEGYHDDLIFNFFHGECKLFDISPSQIIFVTGNSIVEERYRIWLLFNRFEEKINVIPYSHFENDVFLHAQDLGKKIPSFDDQIIYKSNNNISLYSFLNKKTREHRIWFYGLLQQENLLEDGLVSMNKFNSHVRTFEGTIMMKEFSDIISNTTPKTTYETPNDLFESQFYVRRIHQKVMLDSWISVVSEARFEDSEGTVFLSEKIFKPIVCHHPFLILGNRHSLVELKKLGYETFANYIDESYDNDTNLKRMESLIRTIRQIKNIENKLDWYKSMEKTLKHNYEVLRYNTTEMYPYAFKKLQKIFYNKFI